MGLHRFQPPPSGRMGTLFALATVRQAALVEYGCMGHMLYGRLALHQRGVTGGCPLYSTHLDETDIAMGDLDRLRRAVADIIRRDAPKALFFLPSAVPTVIGTDLEAFCKEEQAAYPGIPLLAFGCGGFDVFSSRAVQEALLLLAKTFPEERPLTETPTFNIIGSCADGFRFYADAQEIIRLTECAFGHKPLCILSSHASVDSMKAMAGAHFNLVIRQEGVPAAEHMKKEYGTPYVFGRPYGIEGTVRWIRRVAETVGCLPDETFLRKEAAQANAALRPSRDLWEHFTRLHAEETTLSMGGHANVVEGIAEFAFREMQLRKGALWCEDPAQATQSVPYFSESERSRAIADLGDGLLMGSAEILNFAEGNRDLQIANPDTRWRLNRYEPPLVGFRGAVHLAEMWLNALLEKEAN